MWKLKWLSNIFGCRTLDRFIRTAFSLLSLLCQPAGKRYPDNSARQQTDRKCCHCFLLSKSLRVSGAASP